VAVCVATQQQVKHMRKSLLRTAAEFHDLVFLTSKNCSLSEEDQKKAHTMVNHIAGNLLSIDRILLVLENNRKDL
jgi:hypothetical protein